MVASFILSLTGAVYLKPYDVIAYSACLIGVVGMLFGLLGIILSPQKIGTKQGEN